MDELDKRILRELQLDARNSFTKIAQKTGVTTATVSDRVRRLTEKGIIHSYSAILNAQKLGLCSSTLMAMKVPADKMDEVVNFVNEYMSVTHNYRREHDYNLWFTVTTCEDKDLRSTVEEIKNKKGKKRGALEIFPLPQLHISTCFFSTIHHD